MRKWFALMISIAVVMAAVPCVAEDLDMREALQETLQEGARLIAENKMGDGQGVLWDGEGFSLVRDELNDPGVLDGRYGPFYNEPREAAGLDLSCPIWPETVLTDTEAYYEAVDGTWAVFVLRGDETALREWLDDSSALLPTDDPEIFLFIRTVDNRQYAGYARLTKSGKEARLIGLSGIGLMADIGVMADFLLQTE